MLDPTIFKSKLAWLAYGNISIKIFGFLIFAIISKTLPQAEYAKYAYYLLFIGATLELVNSGLFQGIQNEVSRNTSNEKYLKLIINTSIGIGFLFSIIGAIFVIALFTIKGVNDKVDAISHTLYIGVFFYIVFPTAYSLMNIIFIGIKESKWYFLSIMAQGLISFALIMLLLANGLQSANSILVCVGVSYFLAALLQLRKIRPTYSLSKTALFRLFNKGKWYALWSFASIIESRIDLYLLSLLSSSSSFAIFDVSTKYLVLSQVLTMTLAQKILPEILGSSCDYDKKQQLSALNNTTNKLIIINAILSIPVALFIFVFYSGKYNESIYCFLILSLAMMFNIKNMNNTAKIISEGKEARLFMVMSIVVLFKIPIAWLLIDNLNETGASISVVLSQALSFVLLGIVAKRLNGSKS